MKIIGFCGEKTYLVEASGDELAQIGGVSSEYYISPNGCGRKFGVGQVLRVSEIFKKIGQIRDAKKRLEEAQGILLAVAETIEPVTVLIDEVNSIEEPKTT